MFVLFRCATKCMCMLMKPRKRERCISIWGKCASGKWWWWWWWRISIWHDDATWPAAAAAAKMGNRTRTWTYCGSIRRRRGYIEVVPAALMIITIKYYDYVMRVNRFVIGWARGGCCWKGGTEFSFTTSSYFWASYFCVKLQTNTKLVYSFQLYLFGG